MDIENNNNEVATSKNGDGLDTTKCILLSDSDDTTDDAILSSGVRSVVSTGAPRPRRRAKFCRKNPSVSYNFLNCVSDSVPDCLLQKVMSYQACIYVYRCKNDKNARRLQIGE